MSWRLSMNNPDFLFGLTTGDVSYDEETFPNAFTVGFLHRTTRRKWQFEISDRRNDLQLLCRFVEELKRQNCRMIGYNSIGFDYPVLHFIYKNRSACITVADIYNKAMSIIDAPHQAKFAHLVWESEWLVEQLDLFKIHHFDNMSKSTSLKVLEFNMRMQNIEDLPFDVGTTLTSEQIDILISYMWHDIDATDKFADETQDQIKFRENLSVKYDKNFMNYNDTKIGSEIFIHELEQAGVNCYMYVDNKKKVIQTSRDQIKIEDTILHWIEFEHPEFQRILRWFKSQIITETKGVFKDVNCNVNGLQFDFGTGGIHASVNNQIFLAENDYVVELRDVASYYPNLAIKNKFHPEHLGVEFCNIYEKLYMQRKSHSKGTVENAALKLALNGTYGNSNNQYSPFYDPFFTMCITINGQLLLCLLAEKLMKAPTLTMIQLNTDGLAYRCHKSDLDYVNGVCSWWEQVTQLELETDHISKFFAKDVNNYLMEYAE